MLRSSHLLTFSLLTLFSSVLIRTEAASWYVDSAASGANNGTSWTNAWTSLASASAVSAGDTVFISGGSSGTKNYPMPGFPKYGTSDGARVTYRIGQDAGHNGGVAVFNGSGNFVNNGNITVSGDAGDGKQHFRFSGGSRPVNSPGGADNIRVSYVDCGSRNLGFLIQGGTNIEIDHITMIKTDGGDDYFAKGTVSGSTWDVNKIHHCHVMIPRKPGAGTGDDGIKTFERGTSIYNNTIIGYETTYTGGQHQDGIQPLAGSHLKYYNNVFRNIGNYPIFLCAYSGDFRHVRIYNNILSLDEATQNPLGIAIGPNGQTYAANHGGVYPAFDDILVANNTIADYGSKLSITLDNPNETFSSVFTNCVVKNNLRINSGGLRLDAAVAQSNNVSLTAAQGATAFVSLLR